MLFLTVLVPRCERLKSAMHGEYNINQHAFHSGEFSCLLLFMLNIDLFDNLF